MGKREYAFIGALLLSALLISGCTQRVGCNNTVGISPPDAPGHAHEWCLGSTYTSKYCDPSTEKCHDHLIDTHDNLATNVDSSGLRLTHVHNLKAVG